MLAKQIIKIFLPQPILALIRKYRIKKQLDPYKGLTMQQVFTKIYEEGVWGKSDDPAQTFFSGIGSHEKSPTITYMQAVQKFLTSFEIKPDVVDLGCGDFFIGSNIRGFCGNYIACDIVPSLIASNKEKYKHLNVDFRVLDLTEDELPKAGIVFIRQVLQHLSNDRIKNAIPKIESHYKFIVLTEHLPSMKDFTPNIDILTGPCIRFRFESGIVLTKPPFNLKANDERVICEVPEGGGLIRTTVYKLS